MLSRKFLLLFSFYISYLWFTNIGTSILPAHFLAQNLNFEQMIFGIFLKFIGQILLLVALTTFTAKLSWRLALISSLIYVLLSVTIYNVFQFYLASFIGGFTMFFFFLFYNIAHFVSTPKKQRGHGAALMFIIPSFIGILAPLLAGVIAEVNIIFLWIISILSFALSFYIIKFQEDFKISYNLITAIKEIKATRSLIFIEGIWEAMVFAVLPIYTLYFIKTPLNYGAFLAYLALVSIVANIVLGKLTDRLQKRVIFLYPLTIIMACTTILFAVFKSNILNWIILASVIQFLLPLFWNVSTAMVIDSHPNLEQAIPGREFMLATGRVLGLLIAFISFSLEKSPYYVFLILGGIFFLYPLKLFWNSKISKAFSYL